MWKADPRLVSRATYPFSCRIETRYTDLDPNGHVNFAVMASLFGEARGIFYAHIGRTELTGTILVSMSVDYIKEAFYPGPINSFLGVAQVGRTSWKFQQLAEQNDQPVALCSATMVMVEEGRAIMTPEWRAMLETYQIGSS